VLVIALIVVPAATARLLSDRLAILTPLAVVLGMLGGWLGLVASYEASVDYGIRLAAGATVVLTLVAFYALALAARTGLLRHRRHSASAASGEAGGG
jgi:manganese/iron transport system permease protein